MTEPEPNQRELSRALADLCRTARFSEIIYEHKLDQTTKRNDLIETLITITSASSAIGSWTVFSSGPAAIAWKTLVAFTALLALTRTTYLKYGKRIEHLSKMGTAWKNLAADALALSNKVKIDGGFGTDSINSFSILDSTRTELTKRDIGKEQNDEQLFRDLQAVVNKQLPAASFWTPSQPSLIAPSKSLQQAIRVDVAPSYAPSHIDPPDPWPAQRELEASLPVPTTSHPSSKKPK